MDDDIAPLMLRVRADTQGFARDVANLRATLEGPLEAGADRAGRAIENALSRAIRTGKLGFDDLQRVALSVLAEIASAALRSGLDSLFGGGGQRGGTGGVIGGLAGLVTSIFAGVPGRATGGPVAPGAAYLVGERGPEIFVPTASGRIETGAVGGQARDVRVAITINAPAGDTPAGLAKSSRQIARAVKAAIEGV